MPLVKIEMLAGKTPEYKKTVFDCFHEGLIDAFGIRKRKFNLRILQ